MQQHEITESHPLLDAAGNLVEPGYAKKLLPIYDRDAIHVRARDAGGSGARSGRAGQRMIFTRLFSEAMRRD